MKKTTKKLTVAKETLRQLASPSLEQAAGGTYQSYYCLDTRYQCSTACGEV